MQQRVLPQPLTLRHSVTFVPSPLINLSSSYLIHSFISGDIKDLPNSVTDLNLNGCQQLTGKEWCVARDAPGSRAKNLPRNTLTPSYITLSSGDIKDLPKTVTDLNLALCEKLTGKEGRAMAQGRAQRTFPKTLSPLH